MQRRKLDCSKRFRSNENERLDDRGSIIILVALSLTIFLGFCAIVTDIGLMYAKKAHLQNLVDAAALAGVQELPESPSLAEQTARNYADLNGAASVSVTIDSKDPLITVRATQEVPTYFAHIWGITEEQISASAKAVMVPPEGLIGAVPLGIQDQSLVYGQKYILKSGGGAGTSSWYFDDSSGNTVVKSGQVSANSGWYGALELSGSGADTYLSDLANGYPGTLSVGQILTVKHGNMSGPTEDGVNTRLSRDKNVPLNTFDNFKRDAPEIIYIPIVRVVSSSGSSIQKVQIVGFAAFFLEGVAGNGNNSIVTGWFIRTLVPNKNTSASLSDLLNSEISMENGGSSTDFGLYTPKLVQN